MNTQPETADNSRLWARHHAHAANLLPGNFADNVLREARLARGGSARGSHSLVWTIFRNPFTLSALTACACLAAAIVVHEQTNRDANEQNLADWRDIASQTESLDPL